MTSLQGGNTGLVGGSVPVFDEVVVSTELMTDIETIDPGSGVAVCQVAILLQIFIFFMYHRTQSGVVLENLDQALAEQGLMVPLDLGAKVMIKVGIILTFFCVIVTFKRVVVTLAAMCPQTPGA